MRFFYKQKILFIHLLLSMLLMNAACDEKLYIIQVNNKIGFMNLKGEIVIKALYDDARPFSEGLASVRRGLNWGYINTKGKVVIPIIYMMATDFRDGRARIKKSGTYFINKKNEKILDSNILYTDGFLNGFAVAANDKYKFGLIDLNGNIIIDFKYDHSPLYCISFSNMREPPWFIPYGVHEDRVPFQLGNKIAFFDTKGKQLTEFKFIYATYFDQGLSIVGEQKGGFKIVGLDGHPIHKNGFLKFSYISNIFIAVQKFEKNGKYGFINKKTGALDIPHSYDYAESFSDGLAVVKIKGKYGYINKENKLVIAAVYDEAYSFSEGHAIVVLGDKTGVINSTGKYAIPLNTGISFEPERPKISGGIKKKQKISDNGFIIYKDLKRNKYGYMNMKGKKITEPIFRSAYPFDENGIAKIMLQDFSTGYINTKGEYVWKPSL